MNENREMFGVEGIEVALEQCSGEPACVINSVTTALRAHENGVRPADDQTIVAMKIEDVSPADSAFQRISVSLKPASNFTIGS
jgi:hypothetical protein